MAAAAAKYLFGDVVEAESAGVSPHDYGAAPHAIDVARQKTGIDLSQHTPRDVESLDLDVYAVVVALDNIVAEELRDRFPAVVSKLLTWKVQDPYRGPYEKYEKVWDEICVLMSEVRRKLAL